MWHEWGRGEVPTGLCWATVKEGDHLVDVGIGWRIIFKSILKN
jgi:hypothetical protein